MMVYFIQGETTGKIKIGKTKANVKERLKCLQIGSPDMLTILLTVNGGDNKEEAIIRNLLRDSKSHGEWFNPTNDVLNLMHKIKNKKNKKLINFLRSISTKHKNLSRIKFNKNFGSS